MNILHKKILEFIEIQVLYKNKLKNMKINPKFLILLIIPSFGFTQEPKEDLIFTPKNFIYYDRNQLIPNEEELNFIDKIMENIEEIKPIYSIQIRINTCIYEFEDDSFIEYKRLDYLFDYVKQKFNLNKNFFFINFINLSWCHRNQDENISFIEFNLQHDRGVSIISSEVEGVSFQNVYFEKNQITPSKGGYKFLQCVRRTIQESFVLNKNRRIRVRIIVSSDEKDNTFVTYKRIQYLYDFFEEEIDHNQIQSNIQFEITDDINIKKSHMQFELLEN